MIGIKPILPKGIVFDDHKAKDIINKNMQALAENAKSKFENITSSWKESVSFKEEHSSNKASVTTDNAVFGYVNSGTRPHKIIPGAAKMLQFKTGYRPKTTPNSLGVSSSSYSGATIVRKSVNHPGSAPRNFDTEISKEVVAEIEADTEWFKDL